jgi:hypothetical protein
VTYVRTKLGTVETTLPDASVLQPTITALPLWRGNEQENLICGGCDATIGKSISPGTLNRLLGSPVQIIAVCPHCRANNVIPSTIMNDTGP